MWWICLRWDTQCEWIFHKSEECVEHIISSSVIYIHFGDFFCHHLAISTDQLDYWRQKAVYGNSCKSLIERSRFTSVVVTIATIQVYSAQALKWHAEVDFYSHQEKGGWGGRGGTGILKAYLQSWHFPPLSLPLTLFLSPPHSVPFSPSLNPSIMFFYSAFHVNLLVQAARGARGTGLVSVLPLMLRGCCTVIKTTRGKDVFTLIVTH